MNYSKKQMIAFLTGVFLVFGNISSATTFSGPLIKSGKSAQKLLDSFATASSEAVQELVTKYAKYGEVETEKQKSDSSNTLQDELVKGTFDMIVQEGALLNEAFFAHLGLLMDSEVAAGIDLSKTQTIDTSIALQSGLPPVKKGATAKQSTTIAKSCGTMFNASRYVRGFGKPFSSGSRTTVTSPVDSFYGAVLINLGWYGSETQQPNFNTANGDVEKDNVYWIRSGVNITSLGDDKTFIRPQSAGVARVQGALDNWQSSYRKDGGIFQNCRVLSFVMTDKDGSTAFSSTTRPYQITVAGGASPDITLIDSKGGSKKVSLDQEAKNFLKSSSSQPWAVLVVSSNSRNSSGPEHVPSLKIVGLIRLNPTEFPLHYQAKGLASVGQEFTASVLSEGVFIFKQQIMASSIYSKSSVVQHMQFGSCKDMSFDLTLSTSDPSGMYAQPVNMAIAKLRGALDYQWGTKATMKQALTGNISLLNRLFMKKFDLSAANLLAQIDGKKKISGKTVAVERNPSIMIIGK
jgi:hypothetical protein